MKPDDDGVFHREVLQHATELNHLRHHTTKEFLRIVEVIRMTFAGDNKLLVCGNGGSAADAQHFAAELVSRFRHMDRRALPAIALTTDTSILTAVGNDFGFDDIFSRQVLAIGREGDTMLAISTSGDSKNIIKAATAAKYMGIYTAALTGQHGGFLADTCDTALRVPSSNTARVQEFHMLVLHAMCACFEDRR